MDAEVEVPEPGCCGTAGAFGYESEKGHYEEPYPERTIIKPPPKSLSRAEYFLLALTGFSLACGFLAFLFRLAKMEKS
ncbi:MAG TPA: hypothetical protein V6C86_08325 [Oculatellaceae cyanobacterium]